MVCIGTPSLCLKKVIIAAAHILQPPVDGNADLTAMDTLSPGAVSYTHLISFSNSISISGGRMSDKCPPFVPVSYTHLGIVGVDGFTTQRFRQLLERCTFFSAQKQHAVAAVSYTHLEGIASVDESAITGESAPVVRESGGDFCSVTGGTTVVSDWLKIRDVYKRQDLCHAGGGPSGAKRGHRCCSGLCRAS